MGWYCEKVRVLSCRTTKTSLRNRDSSFVDLFFLLSGTLCHPKCTQFPPLVSLFRMLFVFTFFSSSPKQTSLYIRAHPTTTRMQLVSKLFLAFWALIAVAQFASGATTYSELKDVAKITVGVTGGVAHSEGCTPQVQFLLSLSRGNPQFIFFSRARKKERRSPRRRRVRSGEKNNATLSRARDSFAERRFFASRWGVVRERFSSINLLRCLCSSLSKM